MPYSINVAGVTHYFALAPSLFWLNAEGDELPGEPPKEFWKAVERWRISGRKSKGGRCIVPDECGACRGVGMIDDPEHADYNAAHKRSKMVTNCPACAGKGFVFQQGKDDAEIERK